MMPCVVKWAYSLLYMTSLLIINYYLFSHCITVDCLVEALACLNVLLITGLSAYYLTVGRCEKNMIVIQSKNSQLLLSLV